jgi:hypothetical protein
LRFEIKLRYTAGYDAYRWAIVRTADNETILHSDHRHGLEKMLDFVEQSEVSEHQPLTQELIDGRPTGFEPQGSMSYLTNFIRQSFPLIAWAAQSPTREHWYNCYRRSLQRALIEREIGKGNVRIKR